MNISNNISSINAHKTMLNSSAHNVANVNTEKFVPNSTVIDNDNNSVKANLRQADDSGSKLSQTDLAKEMPDQMIASRATEVNVTAIKTKDEMFGSLLDITA